MPFVGANVTVYLRSYHIVSTKSLCGLDKTIYQCHHRGNSTSPNITHVLNIGKLLHRNGIVLKNLKQNIHHTSRCRAPLSPQEVNQILSRNEFSKDFTSGSVKSYDSNQLPSNSPIEDTRSEARCLLTTGLLMGIYDGHAGAACAQVLSKRLFLYIAASLLPPEMLHRHLESPESELIKTFNDKVEIVEDIKHIYRDSLQKFLIELSQMDNRDNFEMEKVLAKAFLRLDADLSSEVLDPFHEKGHINKKTLSVAMSGAVACVTHIDGPHLHVANVGDCNAVLGVLTENNEWSSRKITKEHNADNQQEVDRIRQEHPSEKSTVIKMDRLLGQLAPLRSMGDFRYKWSNEVMSKVVVPVSGYEAVPPNYFTPPYLSAKPDIYYHRLTPRDKFLIIASDGLWDMMTPLQAVKLVGEHMLGKVFFTPLKLPRKKMQLGDVNELLLHRKEGLKSKPKDRNAATHLMRYALGGTEYGIEHSRLSQLLSLPSDVSRLFRDDITITIVYFDSEYIRHCPA